MASTQQDEGAGPASLFPSVPEGTRVYAVGDIHGRADLLRRMQGLIQDDAASATSLRKVVVYLGDYVDRGPESFAVVETLINDPLAGFESVHLKGNHEEFVLRFVEDGTMGAAWIANGGSATLVSYKVSAFNLFLGNQGLKQARKRLAQTIPESHLDFYRTLRLHHVEGDYLFVHAGLRPGVALADQKEGDLIWIRQEFLEADADFGKLVVHGHSIEAQPDIRANRIGIDTGAYRSGCLTCLVLEDRARRFLQT